MMIHDNLKKGNTKVPNLVEGGQEWVIKCEDSMTNDDSPLIKYQLLFLMGWKFSHFRPQGTLPLW